MGLNKRLFISEAAATWQNDLILHLDASDTNSYSGSGTTWYDLSAEGHDVSMGGGSANPTWDSDGYFDFDGNDYFEISSFGFNTSLKSFGVWFNNDTTSNTVFNVGDGQLKEHYIFTHNSRGLECRMYGLQANDSGNFGTGDWEFAVGLITSSNHLKFYLNGSFIATDTTGFTSVSNDTGLIGGRYNNGNRANFFDGKISKVLFWDREITEDEITALYNLGR